LHAKAECGNSSCWRRHGCRIVQPSAY
jgi:hypothetical protein